MTTIFVLFGCTGQYSDSSEWAVRGYTSKEAADADCAALNAIAEEIKKGEDSAGDSYDFRENAVRERLQPHDAYASMDYTGTEYSVTEMPLVDAPQIVAA